MPTLSAPLKQDAKRDAYLKSVAWSKGILQWKLRAYQHPLYDAITEASLDESILKYVVNCSRRFGKTYTLSLIAIEYALKHPRSQIRFATGTAKAIKKIVNPTIKAILTDCPKALKPSYHSVDMVWTFKNGSEIHLAGTDGGNADNLRGTASHLNIIDEAGFVDELRYVVDSILVPQTLDTKGTTVMISTPPKSPSHEFYNMALEAQEEGSYTTFDIYANTSITSEVLQTFMKASGGEDSTTWKREYLCQFITDENTQLTPEWDDRLIQPVILDSYYKYYHKYVSMDLGTTDFTAALYGYYNFKEGILYIQDESQIAGSKMTTDVLYEQVSDKEREVFNGAVPYRRISDNNNQLLLNDLVIRYGMSFIPTQKSTLEVMLNKVRILLKEGRIIIDPKCEFLIGNLKFGVWAKTKREFGRSTKYKHFDHLAALVYLVLNLDYFTNPVPSLLGADPYNQYISKQQSNNNHALEGLLRAMDT